VFKTMDVRPPMVISLAKKEELVYVQEKGEPLKLPRNHLGLKLLQYARDEAHRFAQHYHHILRRKSQLEEDVKKGRRPPPRKKPPGASAAGGPAGAGSAGLGSAAAGRAKSPKQKKADYEASLMKAPGSQSPHTTHVSLPVMGGGEPHAPAEAHEMLDPEDAVE
jgi:hypothetical protein